MSVLAIDIGNTRIGLNVFTDGKAADPALRIPHAELDTALIPALEKLWQQAQEETTAAGDDETGVVIVSVVPALTDRLAAAAAKLDGVPDIYILGRNLKSPLKTALTDETTVGQDRLAAALAAYVNVEHACAIIHAGTALVVDGVDDEGVFRGGAIAPGLTLSARALHDHAAQLPVVNPADKPLDDDAPFGRNTEEAIRTGLLVGARGAIRELLERYATALGSWPHVVATGGDAQTLLGNGELVDSFIPDLTLQGAALTWEKSRDS